MAAIQLNSSFLFAVNSQRFRPRITSNKIIPRSFQHTIAANISDKTIVRRSANYQPSNWDFDFVESLTSEYAGEPHIGRLEELKAGVKTMLEKEMNPLNQLEMIDILQRLGVAYHFEDEIKELLNSFYYKNLYYPDQVHDNNIESSDKSMQIIKEDLYTTALKFRLLRQQGYNIPQEVFNRFKDEQGNFKAWLCDDVKGLLYLYEASYLLIEGDSILEELREFAVKNLKANVKDESDEYFSMIVNHALELPLHWRMQRVEARWFIDVYENSPDMKPILLQLANLDFNIVQATHQQDLKHATCWWKNTGLGEKLKFARDRPMEGFLWTVGGMFEPQFGYERRMLSRIGALITVIDDIYDVYGTLDEIQLFTDAVERWDINAIDQLPNYMKICFLSLYNTINELGFDILKKQGLDVIPYLKKAWADLCKSYLLEAQWYNNGYTPTLKEYLENGWISISGPLLLVHAYFTSTNQITNEASESLKGYSDMIRWSSMITRLADDLGTSQHELKRGDNPKSVQCYMHETGVSEEVAREHIRDLISEAWKKMNENQIQNTVFSQTFMRMGMNLARMAQCIYEHGDGFGAQNVETQTHAISLLVQPLPLYPSLF